MKLVPILGFDPDDHLKSAGVRFVEINRLLVIRAYINKQKVLNLLVLVRFKSTIIMYHYFHFIITESVHIILKLHDTFDF